MRQSSPTITESDCSISSPLSQDTFQDFPHTYSTSPPLSDRSGILRISQETTKPDSKSSIGPDKLRGMLRALVKQQDGVSGQQESQRAILEELLNRPPLTVVCQAPDVTELTEYRVAPTNIEHILGDLMDRFEVM